MYSNLDRSFCYFRNPNYEKPILCVMRAVS
jgi:hypothetical protein